MRTLIAMSGGVDSAAASSLLRAAGDEIEGCTLLLCSSEVDAGVIRARRTAAAVGIPHRTLDLSRDFHREVVEPFCREYLAGHTPNPCVLCNRHIKLGALYDYARREGFDRLATGHYVRIEQVAGRYRLCKARDAQKDQSYFLYHLREEQLANLCFPLGDMTKEEARRAAEAVGLFEVAAAKESQDICFVPHGDYAAVIEAVTGELPPPGSFVDAAGTVLGTHRGILRYTLGQHKGLGVALGRVRYVTAIRADRHEVVLGDEADLYTTTVSVGRMHYIGDRPTAPHRAAAKLRYRQREEAVTVYPEGEGARLVFDRPQRAPTPGQSCVLYEGDFVLGGGIIL